MQKKIQGVFADTEEPVMCDFCGNWSPVDILKQSETIMIHIVVDDDVVVTGSREVMKYLVNDWSDDKKVAGSLFKMRNFLLTYSLRNMMILSITTEEELMYADIFDNGNVAAEVVEVTF